jgi:mannan endo-1,4-beta-mannosidase
MVLGAGIAVAGVSASLAIPEPALAAGRNGRRKHKSRREDVMPRLTMTRAGMVQRSGVNFRTGGINAFQLVTNDYPQVRLTSFAEVDSLLAKAAALKVGVVRAHTLAASVGNPDTLVTGVSGTGPSPTVGYNQAAWDVIDYAAWKARTLGIYLIPPFVDELGYYHGGRRHWVNFRRPGTVSMDYNVKAANSGAQRAAEGYFYTDQQINWDFEQFLRDWLNHVNPRTGIAFKDDAVFSVVQIGNELWTAAQDAPGWVAGKAALIKSISPRTLVMDSGTDGLDVKSMAWDSPHVDILETHPYSTFTADDVARMARFAATKGKAFAVGEYAWSKSTAPGIERVVRQTGNIFMSAAWSLQNDDDLHNNGAAYGSDDVSLYVPGKDAVQQSAVARITEHHRALRRRAAWSRPPQRRAAPRRGSVGS